MQAPRLPLRPGRRWARGAGLAAGLWLAGAAATAAQALACAGGGLTAAYAAPTDRYPHGALGDDLEWGALVVRCGARSARVELPQELVFEDVAPRLAQLDGQGPEEVITVESHRDRGARLAIWGLSPDGVQRIAATGYIGRRFRWLAPLGAADLDGDGAMELAYVDRPHLARQLRVWRFAEGALRPVASLSGLTNHRFGETEIAGGLRDCGTGPEMILADAGWQNVVAVRLVAGALRAEGLGRYRGAESLAAALACRALP